MTNTRTKRAEKFRSQYPKAERNLSKRQLQIVYEVGRHKYLTTSLVTALLLDTVGEPLKHANEGAIAKGVATKEAKRTGQVIYRELSFLYHHGRYLDRDPNQKLYNINGFQNNELIYHCPIKGKEAIEAVMPDAAEQIRIPKRGNGLGYVEHELLVARCRITLLNAVKSHPDLDTFQWQFSHTLEGTPSLTADGLMQFHNTATNRTERLYIEADNGTETLAYFKKKLDKYDTKLRRIKGGGRVLIVTTSEMRKKNLIQKASECSSARAFLFTAKQRFDPFHAPQVLDSIWVNGKGRDVTLV